MTLRRGLALLDERPGDGQPAVDRATVVFNARLFLRRGDEVTAAPPGPSGSSGPVATRTIDGVELVDHVVQLGGRQVIAGIESALHGMREGGYREVSIPPHLAYGSNGVADRIPPNALLRVQLWLHEVTAAEDNRESGP